MADRNIQTVKISRTNLVSASRWLFKHICRYLTTHRATYMYFLGTPRGPAGVGGESIPSESAQGYYERLLKKIQTKDLHNLCSNHFNRAQKLFFRYS